MLKTLVLLGVAGYAIAAFSSPGVPPTPVSTTETTLDAPSVEVSKAVSKPDDSQERRMVSVDRATLTEDQKKDFEQYLSTASLGQEFYKKGQCRVYEKKEAWCIFTSVENGDRLYKELSSKYGTAVEIEVVNRMPNRRRS